MPPLFSWRRRSCRPASPFSLCRGQLCSAAASEGSRLPVEFERARGETVASIGSPCGAQRARARAAHHQRAVRQRQAPARGRRLAGSEAMARFSQPLSVRFGPDNHSPAHPARRNANGRVAGRNACTASARSPIERANVGIAGFSAKKHRAEAARSPVAGSAMRHAAAHNLIADRRYRRQPSSAPRRMMTTTRGSRAPAALSRRGVKAAAKETDRP